MIHKDQCVLQYRKTQFRPKIRLRFMLSSIFKTNWQALGFNDDDHLHRLMLFIQVKHEEYPIIAGTQGLRSLVLEVPKSKEHQGGSYIASFLYYPVDLCVLLVNVADLDHEKVELSKHARALSASLILESEEILDREKTR